MALSFFESIYQQVTKQGIAMHTQKSKAWFIKNLRGLRSGDNRVKSTLLASKSADIPKVSRPLIGRMYMYVYSPKGKATLPFYDRFPLILMVGPAEGGFYGVNLHFLPIRIRAVFFDRLTELANNQNMDETTKIRATYKLLSSTHRFRAYRPCFKHYLFKHIRSRVVMIIPKYWEIALFVPSDQFIGSTRQEIWETNKKNIL